VLGVIAMVPLTFIAVAWLFSGDANWSELSGFTQLDGSGFFSGLGETGWFPLYMGYIFLLSWNVIAYEAAACYIGECKDPARDAKIALNLEGAYGVFIYTLIPIGFITVLGAGALSNPDLVDPNTIFVSFAGQIFNTGGEALNWIIAGMLIIALMLSALNAIMGTGRALHQMSVDGQFPRFFQSINKHGVPARAMFFNVVASLLVILMGGAVEIYTFSNVGYVASFIPVLIGYYLLRRYRPDVPRPVRLPEFMKYVALALAAIYAFVWLYGGISYSRIGDTEIYYFLGWLVLFAYVPLYLYRTRVEDKRVADNRELIAAGAARTPK
jgi:amino acid transporter